MARSKQYTLQQVSNLLDIPIIQIEWYLDTGHVKGKKHETGNSSNEGLI